MPSDNDNSSGTNREYRGASSELGRIVVILARVIAPTTLITALFFYFGWAFTFERYRYFGVDQSVLSLSTKDYLLRSIIPAFEPLRGLLLFSLCSIS